MGRVRGERGEQTLQGSLAAECFPRALLVSDPAFFFVFKKGVIERGRRPLQWIHPHEKYLLQMYPGWVSW